MENDHDIISTVILLSSPESFKKGCCQLQAKVCARALLVNCLFKRAQEKVWLGELTIAVDLGRRASKQTNKQKGNSVLHPVYMHIFRP